MNLTEEIKENQNKFFIDNQNKFMNPINGLDRENLNPPISTDFFKENESKIFHKLNLNLFFIFSK